VNDKVFYVYFLHEVTSVSGKGMRLITRDFSKAKIGDFSAICKYAKRISKTIKKNINLKDYAIIICNPSTSKTNTSFYIAKETARILRKKFRKIIHLAAWSTGKYYLHMTPTEKTAILKETAYYDGPPVKGKGVIIVDDCVATGTSLKNCIRVLLKHGAKRVTCFAYLRLSSSKFEDLLSQERVFVEGKRYLKKILSNKDNPIVARCLSILFNLPPKDTADIINHLKGARKKELLARLKEYARLRKPLIPKFKEIRALLLS
jgi:hypoxanthine phosphoribosyltransferase